MILEKQNVTDNTGRERGEKKNISTAYAFLSQLYIALHRTRRKLLSAYSTE